MDPNNAENDSTNGNCCSQFDDACGLQCVPCYSGTEVTISQGTKLRVTSWTICPMATPIGWCGVIIRHEVQKLGRPKSTN